MPSSFCLRIFVCITLLFSFAAHAEEIKAGTGTSVANAILKPVKPHFEKATGISITILEEGPRLSLEGVLKGTLDIAGIILSRDEVYQLLRKERLDAGPDEIQGVTVGQSRTVAIVNSKNTTSALSKEQLQGIFSGKITNWSEVGGPDLPIVIVLGKLTGGVNSFYLDKFLGGVKPQDVYEATSGPDVRSYVAATPEAIGITSAAVADSSVKVPGQPEAISYMYIYTKGNPSEKVRKLLDYINGEGQKYLKQ